MTDAYSENEPMTFRYFEMYSMNGNLFFQNETDQNMSCITSVFYFQPDKIIVHSYGLVPFMNGGAQMKDINHNLTVVSSDGMMIPIGDNHDKDCYLLVRPPRDTGMSVRKVCVLDWETDQTVLILSSPNENGVDRALDVLSASTNHIEHSSVLLSHFQSYLHSHFQNVSGIRSTVQRPCPEIDPITIPPGVQ